jgi:hypothetical protein
MDDKVQYICDEERFVVKKGTANYLCHNYSKIQSLQVRERTGLRSLDQQLSTIRHVAIVSN